MVSIVIPAYNEEDYIAQCLTSLGNQKFSEPFEVIVVDNNSTDATLEVAQKFQKRLNLKIVHERFRCRGAARKTGFFEAKGDVILSTDADAILPSLWIKKMLDNLYKSTSIALTGNCKIVEFSKFKNYFLDTYQIINMQAYRLIYHHYWLSGFNFGIYKTIYEKSGGFNGGLNVQEDIDLAIRVHKLGNLKFVTNNPVIVSGRRFKTGIVKGILPYYSSFFSYKILKKDTIELLDIR